MTLEIRPVHAADFDDWRELWQAYLTFYRTTLPEGRTEKTWSRMLDDDLPVHCLIARDDGVAVGFAAYLTHFSTWLDGKDCYLEDLYVAADIRGSGVGRKLIESVGDAARDLGCDRLYWTTEINNYRARGLYDKVAGPSDSVRYRMSLTQPA